MRKSGNAILTQATVIGMMTTEMQTALNIAKLLAIFAALLAALFLGRSPAQAATEPSAAPHGSASTAGRAKPSRHSGEFIS
jgi:hypothetical protein